MGTVLTGLLAGALPATASPADTQLASTNPQNNTPKVVGPSGSRVNAIVRIGDTVIVGGDFTQVQEAAPGSPILTRTTLCIQRDHRPDQRLVQPTP